MAILEIDISNALDCQVHRYVALVTNAVIPKSFWGTKSNFRLVLQSKVFSFLCRPESKVTNIRRQTAYQLPAV